MAETKEISREEKAVVDHWHGEIKKRAEPHRKLVESIKKSRLYAEGRMHEDGAKGLVRTNLIYATMATLIPYVYAKDPDIAVVLTDAVTPDVYEVFRGFSKTAEIVLKHEFVEKGRLKKRMKAAIRSALTSKIGWLKLIYQREYSQDPLLRYRINDAQENIKRTQMLARGAAEGNSDADRKKGELQAQLEALQAQVEVPLSEGLVIDRIRVEDLIILDPTIVDFDEYEFATAIDHVVWMTPETFDTAFDTNVSAKSSDKTEAGNPTRYIDRNVEQQGSSSAEKQEFIRVHEIWHRASNTVYTIADGYKCFCRPPYQPTRLGRRWYPFFGLAFFPVDGSPVPLSLVDLILELQDEYNRTRTQYAEHRADSMPVRVVRKGGSLSEEDVKRIQHRKPLDIIAVEGTPGQPLSNDIGFIPNAEIDPNVYDVTQIRNDIDLVSGVSDASRSNLIDPKTATEAELIKEGMMSRTNEMQDANEDAITEMADFALQMFLLELTEGHVVRVAGPQSVWPRMSKEDVYNMVRIQVRAGSTGKPNKNKEREQWLALLPELKELVLTISQLMGQGMTPIADSLVEIAKETLLRFDEKIDVEKFLPFAKSNDPTGMNQGLASMGPPMVPPEQMQEMQTSYQDALGQVQALEQALAQKDQEEGIKTQQMEQDYQAAVAKAQADAEAAVAQANADAAKAIAEAQAKAQTEIQKAQLQAQDKDAQRQHDQDMAFLASQEKMKQIIADKLLGVVVAGMESGGKMPDVSKAAAEIKAAAKLDPETGAMVDEVAAEIQNVSKFLQAKRVFVRDESGKVIAVDIDGYGRVPVTTDQNGRITSVGGARINREAA
ncbi:MAG: hypothetical protein IT349_19330 [Candidatus Eisenbacteria bacterium]|nr:hypothetical protein [Candidatus Eisenbacteria bacterium]